MKWGHWHKNPFAAIKEVATPDQYTKAWQILAEAPLWAELEADMLMADVLDDVAENLSIVVRTRVVGDGETRGEEYAACIVTETN